MRSLILMFAFTTIPLAMASETDLKKEIQTLSEQIQEIRNQQMQKPSTPDSGKTTLGGYGIINYNKYLKTNSRNQLDLSRFVLSATHQFDENFIFNGELEVEHAISSADDEGEVEVEQAFVSYQFSPQLNVKTGLFLMPFGFLNEAHEPPVYYGVERNEIETRIIPSTWREGGVGIFGATEAGLLWDAGVVTGFDVAKFDKAGAPLAGSHQELQKAKAQDLSLYAAVNYRLPGFTSGISLFTGKALQGNADFRADNANPDFAGINGRVNLADVHARWQSLGFDVQGIYAKGTIGDAADINDAIKTYNVANPGDKRVFVPEEFYGWLVQVAYKLNVGERAQLAPFARFEKFNTQAKMSAGLPSDPANQDEVATLGVSFFPHPRVVYKADYQSYADNTDENRFNLGMGYMF